MSRPRECLMRVGVYGLAVQDGKCLFIRQGEGYYKEKLDLPGGGLEPGETIEEGLHREFREEVGMTFASFQLVDNLSSFVEKTSENGASYLFHRVGLIYAVSGVQLLEKCVPELDYYWMEPSELAAEGISSFVAQLLEKGLLMMRTNQIG